MRLSMKKAKIIFVILIIVLCILSALYYNFVLRSGFIVNKFAEDAVKLAEQNENPVFKIHKIMLYSSATAEDSNNTQALKGINISQYTDIAIYIDNTSYIYDITNENTIKKLYIDNIQIKTNSDMGHPYINYKNALDFAKFKSIDEIQGDKIDFNIVNTNEDNEKNDYSTPTFYTDCSNPITLSYMNKDIVKNHSVSDGSNTISYNGKVLQEANVDLNDINYTISFNINIINNLNEKFINNVKLDVDLSGEDGGIYKGYVYDSTNVSGDEYNFFKG